MERLFREKNEKTGENSCCHGFPWSLPSWIYLLTCLLLSSLPTQTLFPQFNFSNNPFHLLSHSATHNCWQPPPTRRSADIFSRKKTKNATLWGKQSELPWNHKGEVKGTGTSFCFPWCCSFQQPRMLFYPDKRKQTLTLWVKEGG